MITFSAQLKKKKIIVDRQTVEYLIKQRQDQVAAHAAVPLVQSAFVSLAVEDLVLDERVNSLLSLLRAEFAQLQILTLPDQVLDGLAPSNLSTGLTSYVLLPANLPSKPVTRMRSPTSKGTGS